MYYAHTLPGFEPLAWLDIRARLPRAAHRGTAFAEEKNGIVFFDFPGDPAQLLSLRASEDVFVAAVNHNGLSRDYKDLRSLAEMLARDPEVDGALRLWRQAAGQRGTLTARIVSRKTGEHAYRRMDVEQSARKALAGRFGGQLRWVEDDAQLEIWVNVLGPLLLVGLRLSDSAMRHRDYKTEHLPASLRPSAAAAMVLLTEPKPGEVFLDPTCGAGTLLAERAALGPAVILGGDIDRVATRAAQANTRTPILRWNAGKLPLASASVDALACNPPFGKKVGTKSALAALYPALLREAARVLKPGARAVVITSEYDMMRDALRAVGTLTIDRGYAVALLGEWGRIYLLRKNEGMSS